MNVAVPALPHLPSAIQAEGENLLHRQCSLWGQDVKNPGGNLLVRFGFSRNPCTYIKNTRYDLHRSEGPCEAALPAGFDSISLWGFGMLASTSTIHLFLGRFGFQPKVATAPAESAWALDELGLRPVENEYEASRVAPVLLRMIDWIAAYESWVSEGCTSRTRGSEAGAPAVHGLLHLRQPAATEWRAYRQVLAEALQPYLQVQATR